jgi:hypothetical protein
MVGWSVGPSTYLNWKGQQKQLDGCHSGGEWKSLSKAKMDRYAQQTAELRATGDNGAHISVQVQPAYLPLDHVVLLYPVVTTMDSEVVTIFTFGCCILLRIYPTGSL